MNECTSIKAIRVRPVRIKSNATPASWPSCAPPNSDFLHPHPRHPHTLCPPAPNNPPGRLPHSYSRREVPVERRGARLHVDVVSAVVAVAGRVGRVRVEPGQRTRGLHGVGEAGRGLPPPQHPVKGPPGGTTPEGVKWSTGCEYTGEEF